MLTRLLHICGLYLGPESALMPAQPDNPEGFWEHLGFVALNDELLNELGGAWDLPPKANEDFKHPRLDPWRLKARLLVEGFCSSSIWGWKDPRNSLTLPFWQNLLPNLKTLIIVRNPLEVAYSLRERNGTSYSLGLRLWEIYNEHLLWATTPKNRIVSHYDSFFDDPQEELRRILSFIGLPKSKVAKAAALISSERRHTHFTTQQLLDAQIPPRILQLYQRLSAQARRVTDAELAASSKVAKQRSRKGKGGDAALAATLPASGALNLAVLEVEKLRKELAAHQVEFQRLNAPFSQISAAVHRSEAELKQRDATIAANNAELQRLKADIEQISAAIARSEHELQHRDATIAANKADIEQISAAIARSEHELQQRDATIAANKAEIQDLSKTIETDRIQLSAKSSQTAELTDNLGKLNQDIKSFGEVFGLTRQRLQDSDAPAAVLIQSLS